MKHEPLRLQGATAYSMFLLAITLIWGATFVVVKRATEDLPVFPFLAIRFGLAFVTSLNAHPYGPNFFR